MMQPPESAEPALPCCHPTAILLQPVASEPMPDRPPGSPVPDRRIAPLQWRVKAGQAIDRSLDRAIPNSQPATARDDLAMSRLHRDGPRDRAGSPATKLSAGSIGYVGRPFQRVDLRKLRSKRPEVRLRGGDRRAVGRKRAGHPVGNHGRLASQHQLRHRPDQRIRPIRRPARPFVPAPASSPQSWSSSLANRPAWRMRPVS